MDPKKDIVVVDLDGTLALDEHRAHLIQKNEPKRWDEYFNLCGGDAVNHPIAQLVRILHYNKKVVYILSGRIDRVKEATVEWLSENNIPYHVLLMRKTTDRTQDTELKLKWIEELGIADRIWMVLEDRARVVKSWRDAGYTCLQVAPGEF